jgi:hypothetical protein
MLMNFATIYEGLTEGDLASRLVFFAIVGVTIFQG